MTNVLCDTKWELWSCEYTVCMNDVQEGEANNGFIVISCEGVVFQCLFVCWRNNSKTEPLSMFGRNKELTEALHFNDI